MNAKTYSMNRKQTGFTLIELMVTLTIATILFSVAVPNLSNMTQNNRLSSQSNQFIASHAFARSEAVKRAVTIDVIAISPVASNEWGAGWRVAINGGVDLKIFPIQEGSSTLNSNGDISTIQYFASGRPNITDTLDLCDGRTNEVGRQMTLLPTGRMVITNSNLNC